MKALPIIAAILGVAVMAMLVGYFGADAVMHSLAAVGVGGFVAVCVIHLALTAVMGLAWRALLPGVPSGRVMWARLMRDSGSEALPLSQVGGYVLGVRALAWQGAGDARRRSTIVDVTLEFVAQLAYHRTWAGAARAIASRNPVAMPVLLGLAVAAAAVAFVLVQRRGLDYFDRLARRSARLGRARRRRRGGVARTLAGIYRNAAGYGSASRCTRVLDRQRRGGVAGAVPCRPAAVVSAQCWRSRACSTRSARRVRRPAGGRAYRKAPISCSAPASG
jgi:hypothetical protein